MTAQSDPYSRVYWRFIDEFPEVYNDDGLFAAWMRLLIAAEGVHPSSASVPRTCKSAVLNKLVDAELIELAPGDRYRVRGLDAERARRAESARIGGLASGRARAERTLNDRPADGERTNERRGNGSTNEIEPRRDEQRRDETSKDETHNARVTGTELQLLAEELTQRSYALPNLDSKLGEMALRQLSKHGLPAVEKTWRNVARAAGPMPSISQIVLGADHALNPIPGKADLKSLSVHDEADAERQEFERGVKETRRRNRDLYGDAYPEDHHVA